MTVEQALATIRPIRIPGYGEDEVRFFAETIWELQPTHIFEWGTNVGASARVFYELTRIGGIRCDVHTTEHPDHATHDHPGHLLGRWLKGCNVKMHTGDGVNVSLAEYVHAGAPEQVLFFLDGDHSYAAVLRELEAIAATAPSAVILVHDTSHPVEETEAAVDDFLIDKMPGVYEPRWLHSQAGVARLWPRQS